ncbi:hypothetical protein ABZY57_07665 [Streptomyces sp. NPDC006450]|uniref:hypothetical protein n=1 Tax=Streptomyces sp. NPDC006450 TaxID=3155458 RepID=UPI0033BBB6B4
MDPATPAAPAMPLTAQPLRDRPGARLSGSCDLDSRQCLSAALGVVTAIPGPVVHLDLSDARRTHPTLIEEGQDLPSPAYTDAPSASADCDRPLPEPEGETGRFAYAHGGLAELREYAEASARRTALPAARRGDLVLAVSEAAANSPSTEAGRAPCACGPPAAPGRESSPRSTTAAAWPTPSRGAAGPPSPRPTAAAACG